MISINKDGVLDGSIKLDILNGQDRSEYYHFNGKINATKAIEVKLANCFQ